jgi:hypothetical protein
MQTFTCRSLPKYDVTATLQCAGNRRTAMSKVRKVRGVGWDISALGNGKKYTMFIVCTEECCLQGFRNAI